MTAHRPLVGLTGRQLPGSVLTSAVGYADAPVEAFFGEYGEQVWAAGGFPVNLPWSVGPDEAADLVDGLVLSGGGDIDPAAYGGVASVPPVPTDPRRDRLELDLLDAVLSRGKPVLGICRGAQLVNVGFGGSLVADLPVSEGEAHASYDFPRDQRRHVVRFAPGTTAHGLYGDECWVNSFHHQSVDRPGHGVVVSGLADDGVVEAIELPGLPVLGLQWHPESLDHDPAFGWLVRAARALHPVPTAREAIA